MPCHAQEEPRTRTGCDRRQRMKEKSRLCGLRRGANRLGDRRPEELAAISLREEERSIAQPLSEARDQGQGRKPRRGVRHLCDAAMNAGPGRARTGVTRRAVSFLRSNPRGESLDRAFGIRAVDSADNAFPGRGSGLVRDLMATRMTARRVRYLSLVAFGKKDLRGGHNCARRMRKDKGAQADTANKTYPVLGHGNEVRFPNAGTRTGRPRESSPTTDYLKEYRSIGSTAFTVCVVAQSPRFPATTNPAPAHRLVFLADCRN